MKRLFYCGFTPTVSSEPDVLYVNTAVQLTLILGLRVVRKNGLMTQHLLRCLSLFFLSCEAVLFYKEHLMW